MIYKSVSDVGSILEFVDSLVALGGNGTSQSWTYK